MDGQEAEEYYTVFSAHLGRTNYNRKMSLTRQIVGTSAGGVLVYHQHGIMGHEDEEEEDEYTRHICSGKWCRTRILSLRSRFGSQEFRECAKK